MPDDLPLPFTPPDGDLRDFAFTPVYRSRLFSSRFHARATDAEWRAAFTLWLKSWDQVPAGSLPDDDIDLCRLAELGRDLKQWTEVREMALRGWQKCSDGLLYHQVVAEGVNDALSKKKTAPKRGLAGASAKWGRPIDQMNKQNRHERLAAARVLGTHTKSEWQSMVVFCENRCLRCSSDGEIVKDHILPLYQGGSDSIDNLQPLCRTCNASKGADSSDLRPAGWLQFLRSHACEMPTNGKITSATLLQTSGNRQGQGHRQGQVPTLRVGTRETNDPDFARFWTAYPRKDDKGHARKAWKAAMRLASADQVIAGVQAYPFQSDPTKQPMAATWLNGERWLVERNTAPRTVIVPQANKGAAGVAQQMGIDALTPMALQDFGERDLLDDHT